jgi:hypothetical protein
MATIATKRNTGELITKPGIVPAQNHGVGRIDRSRLNWREPSTRSIAAQTLRIAIPLVGAWPDLIFGADYPKPRPIASRQGHLPQGYIGRLGIALTDL